MRLAILATLMLVAAPVLAGPPCYAPVYKPAYVAPAPVYVPPPPPVIVNNLIGIPVPVAYEKPLALQGKTVYGYTSVHDVLGPLDLALLFDKSERLASQAQQLSAQATSDFAALVQSERDKRQEVARILAASQAVREVLSESAKLSTSSGGVLALKAAPTSASGVLQASCVKCHSKYSDWSTLTDDQRTIILERVTTSDASKRMPRGDDKTSAGQPLPVEHLKLLFTEK